MKNITCFLPLGTPEETRQTVAGLQKLPLIEKVIVVCKPGELAEIDGVDRLEAESISSGKAVFKMAELSGTEFTLIYNRTSALKMGQLAIERFFQVATDTQSGLVYSNYLSVKNGKVENMPVIDYQEGSLRDDFNFGSVLFYNTAMLKKATAQIDESYKFAGLYALRLGVSLLGGILRIHEYLYTEQESDLRKSGEKIFDYVDPKNRAVQIEMEIACTRHLKKAGA